MSSLVLLPRLPFAYASSEAFPLIVESWISSSSGTPLQVGWFSFAFWQGLCVTEAKIPQGFLCGPIT